MRSVLFSLYYFLLALVFISCTRTAVNTVNPLTPPASTDSSHIVKNMTINPTSGSFNDTVVVSAANITYTDSVMFNGVRGRIVGHLGDSLQVIVPFLAGPGPITIAYGSNKICEGPYFTYNYTSIVITIGGTGQQGSSDADGIALDATINGPYGVALDQAGNVFVAEAGHPKIRKIGIDGSISTYAGTGTGGYVDGPGNTAQFNSPYSIVLDKTGNVYFTDPGNQRIRKIDPSGVVSTLAGNGNQGNTDGPGNMASFHTPFGIAIDPQGNILVADQGNQLIRKITPAGMVSTLITGPVHQYMNGKDTTIAGFYGPTGICTDLTGNIFITDAPYVREIITDGTVTSIAGDGNQGDRDGQGHDAELSYPMGIVCDPKGNIFISDFGTFKIKQITSAGNVTTIAGVRWFDYVTFLDGPALKARFYSPVNIALDKTGNIYVADNNNLRVRKIIIQ
ncbi:MAG: NHL repeat-containing protein [Bacteroidota bacterium]|nr:NHL repeat-containing protein [Bacteroidota bacterium]